MNPTQKKKEFHNNKMKHIINKLTHHTQKGTTTHKRNTTQENEPNAK